MRYDTFGKVVLLVAIIIVPVYVFAANNSVGYTFTVQPRGCTITPNIWSLGNVTAGLSYASPNFSVGNPSQVTRKLNMTWTITPLGIGTVVWGFEGTFLAGKTNMNVTFILNVSSNVVNVTKGSGTITVNCL